MNSGNVDLSLYLVTERKGHSLSSFFDVILESIKGGVTIVQLREKHTSYREFLRIAKELHDLLKPLNIPLIINDSIEIAKASGAEGVHLGQSDQSVVGARTVLGEQAIIGLSIETLEQAQLAQAFDLNYIAASPVFNSRTKTDTLSPWGLEGLRTLCQVTRFPVISIGGINYQNVDNVFKAGSSGVAVISAIWDAVSPCEAARELSNKIKQIKDHENQSNWRR